MIYDLNYFVALFISGSMLALWGGAPLLSILFMFAGAGTHGITLTNVSAISTDSWCFSLRGGKMERFCRQLLKRVPKPDTGLVL
ncbi:hypothetical protein [Geomonas silvestris]|uniref:hypothetical protein n=1 Tax=Geomonas silvestris TaxID=2740184 RepID=UPI00160C6705|nr:hypothetical protein [Geomonas silvestris]